MLQKRKFGVKWLRDLTTGDANPTTRAALGNIKGGAPCGGGRRTSWWGKAPHVGGLGARVGHAVVDYAVPCG